MQKTKTHWPSLLILGLSITGAGLFLLAALGFGIGSLLSLIGDGHDPAGPMIAAFSAEMEGLILLAVAWFVLHKTLGRAHAELSIKLPFVNWHIFAGLGIIGMALLVGGVVSFSEIKWLTSLFLPVLTILVIVPPIWILLGLGTQGLDFGPRWRAWGIFGIGMTLGPLIMITLEIVIIIALVIIVAFYIVAQPGMAQEITRLASLLENETSPEVILELVSPYVVNPGVITAAFLFFALAIPLIEELFKPLAIWLFARTIETPSQGFALGLLSGAAYALIESLGVSGQGDASWAAVVAVRAGTSLLHITTTGLMGRAIVAAWRNRRILNLILTYAAVVVIHGIWNGSVVSAGIATIADTVNSSNWAVSVIPAALCGMAVLLIGLLVVLVASNRRARKLAAQETQASNPPVEEIADQITEGVK